MSDKLKKFLSWGLIFIVLFGILFLMFKDSYKEILLSIKATKLRYIFLVILLGYIYQVLDAVPCWLFIKNYLKDFSLIKALQVIYLGVFMSTATLGAGIAPAQAYFLYKQGLDAGRGLSLMSITYIFHKTVIMLYSLLVLIFFGARISGYTDMPIYYIGFGYIAGIAIVLVLLIVCTSKSFINLIIKIMDNLRVLNKWNDKMETLKKQMLMLNAQSREILKHKSLCLKIFAVDFIKMTVLYLIPYVCFMGVSGEVTHNIFEMIMLSSIMRLLIDVAPNVGGIGPTEIAFTMIFMVSFGEVEAGAAMILYRLATYYIPFLTSAISSLYTRKKGMV